MNAGRAILAAASIAAAAPPEWAVSGKWSSCPPSSCWTGTGSGTTLDQARQGAMADVSRQVRSRIRSESRDSRWEESGAAGEASSVKSNVQTDERIDGIQVVETTQDGATWYALATLRRSDLSAPGRAAMSEASNDAIDRTRRLREALAKNRYRTALDEFDAIGSDRRRFLAERERASLGEPQLLSEAFPVSGPVLDSFARLIRVPVALVAPDTVSISRDNPGAGGVAVKASWNGTPVDELEIELLDPAGKTLAQGRTDAKGELVLHPASWSIGPLVARSRSGQGTPVERKVAVRRSGTGRGYKLVAEGPSTDWIVSLGQSLSRSGWTLDPLHGRILTASLKANPKGTLEGVSGQIHRMEVRLVLRAQDDETSCAATATGPDSSQALTAAVRKLDCAPF